MDYLDQELTEKLREAIGEHFEGILATFLDRVEPELAQIREAIAGDDLPEVARLAHASKGSAASLGACGLASAFALLVDAARAGNRSDCVRCIAAIPELLAATRSAFISGGFIKSGLPCANTWQNVRNHDEKA